MGGNSSKPTSYIEEIDTTISSQFEAHCTPTANSAQIIELQGLNIIAKDNCRMEFMNKASVDSTCEMSPIIDGVSKMAVETSKEFAEILQGAMDREANKNCDADNCEDKLRVAVTKHLTAKCASETTANQTLKMNGGVIFCTGNTVSTYGNYAEVRASCLQKLLHDAHKQAFGDDSDTSQKTDIDVIMVLTVTFIFFAVLRLINLTKQSKPTVNTINNNK